MQKNHMLNRYNNFIKNLKIKFGINSSIVENSMAVNNSNLTWKLLDNLYYKLSQEVVTDWLKSK